MATYTIKSGDSLSKIAAANGTTVAQLLELNPSITNPDLISVGAVLQLPGTEVTGSSSGTNPARPENGGREFTGSSEGVEGAGTGPTADIKFNSVGGKPEVWKNTTTGENYLVYYVPNTEPPVPLIYTYTDAELKTVFGTQSIVYDRQLTESQVTSYGAIDAGTANDVPTEGDPFENWFQLVESQAAVRPWLREPDVLALIAEATIEGRSVSQAEFEQTEWWQTHNKEQRDWLLAVEADPMSAQGLMDDNRVAIEQLLKDNGVNNAPEELVNFIANEWTTGNWSRSYAANQVRALSDPYSGVEVDRGLNKVLGSVTLDTTRAKEQEVKDLVLTWLGPVHGAWSTSEISRWAGKLRNDPDAVTELTEMLQGQRVALYPTYENRNLTYNDIASPWKNRLSQMWGTTVDETDPLLDQMIKANDLATNDKLIRGEGLKRGNGTIQQSLTKSGLEGFGGNIRRDII